MKVVVIGAGAAGLAVGWRLVQAGADVTVLDRGLPGRGATWASAGMVQVIGDEAGQNESEAAFARRAGMLWPDFAAEIEDASGRNPGFRADGKLAVAETEDDWARLSAIGKAACAAGRKVEMLGMSETIGMEPMLRADITGALWDPAEAQVDNRILGTALAAAFINAGGSLLTTEAVVRLEMENGKVAGARTPFTLHLGDAFVLAAGAWTAQIEGLPREVVPPVFPVKGEMIALAAPEQAALPKRVVGAPDAYLVPRHGRLFVGATVADEGFDTSLTPSAAKQLHAAAARIMPALGGWEVADQWAGLRPGSPDGLPILGRTDVPNLFVASGQYRNGILFTPAIAEALRDIILERGTEPSLAAFDPRRFTGRRAHAH